MNGFHTHMKFRKINKRFVKEICNSVSVVSSYGIEQCIAEVCSLLMTNYQNWLGFLNILTQLIELIADKTKEGNDFYILFLCRKKCF